MTLAEKVGQLNQFNGGWYSTGPISSDNEYNNKRVNGLRNGSVGSMLNVTSVEATKEAQRIAVEESRLGIPSFCLRCYSWFSNYVSNSIGRGG